MEPSFSSCLVVLYKGIINFCILTFYRTTSQNSFISSSRFQFPEDILHKQSIHFVTDAPFPFNSLGAQFSLPYQPRLHSCFNVLAWESSHLAPLRVGMCWLFLSWEQLLSSPVFFCWVIFGLCPELCECYVVRTLYSVMFLQGVLTFCCSRQLIWFRLRMPAAMPVLGHG